MNRETFDHIREDVRNAMVENRQDDPALLPELVMYLLDQLGEIALGSCLCADGRYDNPLCYQHGEPKIWAAGLLERCQLRAISMIPFAEQQPDPDTYWSDHL